MMTKILIVDDKQMMRDSVGATLQRAGFQCVVASDGATALTMLGKHRPAAVLTDLKMPEMDGLELLGKIKAADDSLPVVLMTAYGNVDAAVRAMKLGAFDFIQKPFEGDQLVLTIKRAVDHRQLSQENAALKSNQQTFPATPVLVGTSPAMRQLAQQIQQIAHSSGTVMISGESGTGKEVIARTIHAHSQRRGRVMLAVNCAALSSNLLESELFGHEKGAFTGADALRKGRFELADGGTLLLDEVSEISSELQAKLLRVLQEQQFERVGSSYTMNIDVRVVATTNRELRQYVMEGSFRQDLYYRLNVLPIHVPPLRERTEDVALLAEHFLGQVALREGREAKAFDEEALGLMREYPWPGNVRELQNICERASVLSRERVITAGTIQPWLIAPLGMVGMMERGHPGATQVAMGGANGAAVATSRAGLPRLASPVFVSGSGVAGGSPRKLEETEREQVLCALGQFQGNRQRTAAALGIGVRTLGLKLKKWKEQNLVAQTI